MNTPLPAAQRLPPGTLTPRIAAPLVELFEVDDPLPALPLLLEVPVGLLVTVPVFVPLEEPVGVEAPPRVLHVSEA